MLLYTVVLMFCLLFVIEADDTYAKDGTCPIPPALQSFKYRTFSGVWFDHYTQDDSEKQRRCIQNVLAVIEEDGFFIVSRYYNASGGDQMLQEFKRAKPVPRKVAEFNVDSELKLAEWTHDPWGYVFVGTLRNGEAYIEYSHKVIDGKCYDAYHIRSRKPTMTDKHFKELSEMAVKNGDKRPFAKIDQTNCKYSLEAQRKY